MWRITAFDRDGRRVNSLDIDGGEVTIGRDADRSLVLPSASVSRRHAKLVLNGPQPFVIDEGSANGVVVNGQRIAGPTAIVPGVRVDIAEFHLEFEQPGMGPPPPMIPGGGFTEAVAPISDRAAPPMGDLADVVRLVANGGPFDGRIFDVPPGEVGVGRAVDNELVLDDPSLSRKHAKMRRVGVGRVEVEDLNSSNGTYVNGRKVGRGAAGPGDTVRFGDLIFRVQGSRGDGTRAVSSGGGGSGMMIGLIVGAVVLIGGGAAAYFLVFKKPSGPTADLAKQATLANEHVRAGKAKLAAKNWSAASSEFDQAIELDPTNTDARTLKVTAESEPLNEQNAKRASDMIDKGHMEQGVRFLEKIPADSSFKQSAAKTVASKLIVAGEAACKQKQWRDCAWDICKAYELAPDAKPADADKAYREAEKKLSKDKSWTGCKAKH